MIKINSLLCTVLTAPVLFSASVLAAGYQVNISCGDTFSEYVEQCFTDSNLTIDVGDKKTVYGADGDPFNSMGYKWERGMAIDVPEHFVITAKNSSDIQRLKISVVNASGVIVKKDEADEGEVIIIDN